MRSDERVGVFVFVMPTMGLSVIVSHEVEMGFQISIYRWRRGKAKPAAGRLIIGTIALLTASTSSEDPVVGGNTYMTYLITTWTNIPELNGTEISLRRRFKDFVTLSDRLSDSYREFFFR
ncbi:hypothetical protein L2E82_51304 [Cichorium intybus]|nr:hypothetical protein L2E82_51304 [Cichorium intybus]